ncbi:MAG: response regulator transcription factor [Actinomycetota bacterium]|nr:response regulator transcription factor [Actinomycetota bacterium]
MKILVVDDDEKLRALIARALSEEGHIVDSTADGEEAIYLAGETSYDAIVLDWMLPGRSGVDVCRHLRAQGHWTPVLMLTAKDALEDRVTGLDSGADDYLVKPFAFSELTARLRALVRRGSVPRPVELQAGDIRLDPVTRAVSVGSNEMSLTPKEFSLLEYLMRHKGRVLTRVSLIEHVWDFAYDGGSNVVDVYIGYLRKKLGAEGDRLETIRGVGYRLKE